MFLQPMPIMADRISTLPDSILCHILSYLPTKQAVATSILSKRWRPLWLSVPTLDFDFRSYSQNRETYSRFIHLVYTAMLLRDGSQPIKRLSLECTSSSFCDASMVNTVVTVATKRNVEHLCLVLPSTISLPSSVLTSRTLVVLNLKKLNVCLAPSSVDLPSLKTLHLTKVRFAEQAYLSEILSACPTLEVLLMKFLRFDNELSGGVFKHLPKLVKADISNSKFFLPFEALYNVERLRADVWLTSEAQYSFLNLTCVELIFQHYCWEWLIDLLCGCPRLQNLVIIEKNEYSEADSHWLQLHSVPECLNTQLKTLCVRKYGGKESELQFTSYIMQNARALRSVTICSTRYSNLEEKNEMMKKLLSLPRSSPTCQLFFE